MRLKPPEGDNWLHEVKFDGYRTQIVKDADGVRLFTRRGLDWTPKYRDLAKAAVSLDVESAIIDGEIIVLNNAGLPDLGELRAGKDIAALLQCHVAQIVPVEVRKAVTRRDARPGLPAAHAVRPAAPECGSRRVVVGITMPSNAGTAAARMAR
ncbi:ATP-dependent DNA ligase [Mesorhizobium ventifaucium]|uniref:ATP-dependent DNA ligase family profile domain-containing protein n=1 Tax=Mesorhizobium ventifaucium TaxID=666020 RepID=A0ABN8K3B5_9HYPH|nr:hypothetical protein [Mesorhizobium ventifaucium]CAH2404737.1 hypothetical protein MES4922_370013 [Mesorhizobium ventifaucium]